MTIEESKGDRTPLTNPPAGSKYSFMVIYSLRAALAAALLAAVAGPTAAQTLTLAEALRRADTAGYGNRAARGLERAAAAAPAAALAGLLPAVRLEAGWQRTTDPVGVFGTRLRQRAVTAADFAPAALNGPAPLDDVIAAAAIDVPLVNADAWLGRTAARHAHAATAARGDWTAAQTQLDVVRAYFGALLARERVITLEAARRAARDHVRQANAMADQGLVTRSDALLAQVKAGEVESDLLGAHADARLARAALALLLGAPGDTTLSLPDSLPGIGVVRGLAGDSAAAAAERADVRAAGLMLAAATADARRSRAVWLPRLNAFGRQEWHSAASLAAGRPMWSVGVIAQWSLLSWANVADRRAAQGRLAAARAGAEAAQAQASFELAQREAEAAVADSRLVIAEQAVAQAAEAHRIVSRKYEGGIATVVELLDAAAVETATRLRHAAARFDLIVAVAARRQAKGLSLGALDLLDRP